MITERVSQRMVVFSGKGGVGKTTVAVNLAYAFARQGKRVGLLDADLTGPNVPKMTGITEAATQRDGLLVPHERDGVKIVSLASLVPPGAPIIWRGPMRSKALEQLIDETDWGGIEILITDLPPGTGDEVLTIAQKAAPQLAVVVTTPQEVALLDARRAIAFAKKLEIPTIGLIENMAGLICPHCGGLIDLFGSGSVEAEARRANVEFLGAIPLDPSTRLAGDAGTPILIQSPDAAVSQALSEAASRAAEILQRKPS